MKRLVVNADDFNLTRGSARAILDAHRKGIVSSTSVFTNFNFEKGELDQLRKVKSIGIGLHLNVTLDRPLAQPKLIRSLVNSKGIFKKQSEFRNSKINSEHLFTEYELQLLNFRAIFGKNPDHLNTHHHVHELPVVAIAVIALAKKYQIPVRRSSALVSLRAANQNVIPECFYRESTGLPLKTCGSDNIVKTSDYFFGSLNKAYHWTETSLLNILKNLPAGTSEIMCHPAYVDSQLKRISSFSVERKSEFQLFSNPIFRRVLQKENIVLSSSLDANRVKD